MARVGAAVVGLLLTIAAAQTLAAEVIVNRAQPENSINRAYLRGMFGMRLRAWADGTPVQVYVLADDDPAHTAFCTEVLQVYPYQLRQNWDRLVYSGTGQPPTQVDSEEEMRRRVSETPGAIGYLAGATSLSRSSESAGKVKVLNVR